mmetsp:Transcript_32813/g.59256  ORF Transcript_32813/g.59256 Transcript_32813/m.59256 type:complete len:112 (+) Transcript_32813:2-337(+)
MRGGYGRRGMSYLDDDFTYGRGRRVRNGYASGRVRGGYSEFDGMRGAYGGAGAIELDDDDFKYGNGRTSEFDDYRYGYGRRVRNFGDRYFSRRGRRGRSYGDRDEYDFDDF